MQSRADHAPARGRAGVEPLGVHPCCGVVPIAPLAGRPRSAGRRSPGRLFCMARTIAANAAYPSVGHIPLRRELDDATGMGGERLIIGGKARTASRHCLVRCGAESAAGLAHSPRSETTKKDLLRSKPQIKACGGSSGTWSFSLSLQPAERASPLRRSAWRSRKVLGRQFSLRRIRRSNRNFARERNLAAAPLLLGDIRPVPA